MIFISMNKTLIVVDAYLSNLERAFVCERMIDQIKESNFNFKILLLNKSGKSFGLDKKVDYYYNHSEGFMVGYPPQELLDQKKYSRPYVYFETPNCILENWMPLINVTDHVANIYNSYVLSSRLSTMLGFEKFFRVEFDIDFDNEDLDDILTKVSNMQDFLIFGYRQEGKWMGANQFLMDVHISGFDNRIFDGYDLVRDDTQYWEMCNHIKYFGKWIEYVIPAILQTKNLDNLVGHFDVGKIRDRYPKTKFDVVSSPGEWKNKWYEIPKLCRVSSDDGSSKLKDKLGVFFLNDDFEKIIIETKLFNSKDEIIFHRNNEMGFKVWSYDVIHFDGYVRMESRYFDENGKEHYYTREVTTENLDQLNCRMLVK